MPTLRLRAVLLRTAAAVLVAFAAISATGSGEATAAPQAVRNAAKGTLAPFRSDAQLRRYLAKMRAKARRAAEAMPPPPPPSPAAAAPGDAMGAADAAAVRAPGAAEESITNTQEAGVDEGGIVKVRGDILVILRRGRLFTVSTADGALKPVDAIDAFPPGVDPRSDWYDEMLISGDRVIVVGYSYGRGGTEINRFRLSPSGRLSFEDAHHLRSNDYYSSRNYASRVIGTRLIVYTPLYLPYEPGASLDWLPGVRKWTGNEKASFRRIAAARDIYVPPDPDTEAAALHTVMDCDLAAAEMACSARGVLGPSGRTFYVSANAVYIWASEPGWRRREEDRSASSMLYRLPLRGGAPSAIGVRGAPIDQFSFQEDWNEGRLNVLVRSEGGGDAMWRPEFSQGDFALLRLPLRAFGDGTEEARRRHYRDLPSLGQHAYTIQNRFVGEYLLYGAGASWGPPKDGPAEVVTVNVRGNYEESIALPHAVDRIEAMGADAVVIGGDARDLHFTAMELTAGPKPVTGDRYTLKHASQGETRSHAFFFKQGADTASGILGLPVARASRPGYKQLRETSASVLFVRRALRKFSQLGELEAEDERVTDDGCKASCVDWYGNSRPIFLRGRTFALMGYEIVEGDLLADAVREVRRVNFAPRR